MAFAPSTPWKLPCIITWDGSRNQNLPTDSAEEAEILTNMSKPTYRTLQLLILLDGFTCLGMWRLCAQNVLEPARQADFKAFIAGFKDNYAYRDRAEKPWETWQNRYSAAVDSATSPEVYAAVLESALDELHDFHAEVRSRNPHRWLPVPTFADIWAELHGQEAVVEIGRAH